MDLERLLALTQKQLFLFSQLYYTCQDLQQEYEKLSEKYNSYNLKDIQAQFLQMQGTIRQLDEDNFDVIQELKEIYDTEIQNAPIPVAETQGENNQVSNLSAEHFKKQKINGISLDKKNQKKDKNQLITMSANGYQSYDNEIKIKAMEMLEKGEKLQTISKQYNIPPATIYYWQTQGKVKTQNQLQKLNSKQNDITDQNLNTDNNSNGWQNEDMNDKDFQGMKQNGEQIENGQSDHKKEQIDPQNQNLNEKLNNPQIAQEKKKTQNTKNQKKTSKTNKNDKKQTKKGGKNGQKNQKDQKIIKKKIKKRSKTNNKPETGVHVDKKYDKYYKQTIRSKPNTEVQLQEENSDKNNSKNKNNNNKISNTVNKNIIEEDTLEIEQPNSQQNIQNGQEV
ncbi:Homeodomain protein [Pseudocohnilembus persalinus]|uniref:Homeodomain protein n=1 Tax=Pseudocohnilembus persalinus TaxID=266149 RepID=A0A0V0QDA1_PSEPJ|nr:Homeodomain protein [Pseudocohnilembus persalinus]|eukprot:KRX00191.1 Homeodomain protein [Pseudocohnilembus persalinus]